MARRVHQIKDIGFAVLSRIFKAHSLGFNRNTALFLDIHIIQHLLGHFPIRQAPRIGDQAVGQSGFAMVDMGDNGKIPDKALISAL